jgi:hypothetical protein
MGTLLNSRRIAMLAFLIAVSPVIAATGTSAKAGSHRPKTLIACLVKHEFKYFDQPSRCDFFARQYYPNGRLRRFRDVGGRHLKWSNWGESVAVGEGVSIYAVPLRVVAYRRTPCPDGRWYYGEVSTHSSVGRDQHLRLARCGAKRFPTVRSPGSRGS